jgi:hypothetical protein
LSASRDIAIDHLPIRDGPSIAAYAERKKLCFAERTL